MAIIKCEMCGGDIELSADKTFGTCEYCGCAMTLPMVASDQHMADETDKKEPQAKRKKFTILLTALAAFATIACLVITLIVLPSVKDKEALATKENIAFASGILGRKFDAGKSITVSKEEEHFLKNVAVLFGIKGHYELGTSTSGVAEAIVDLIDWTSDSAVDNFDVITDALKALYGSNYVIKPYSGFDDTYMWKDVDEYEYVLCWQNQDGSVTIRWTVSV